MSKRQQKNERFEQFWQIYPRQEVKVRARRAFERINPDDELLRTMLQWIEQAKYSEQWQEMRFIPHPATWLNQHYWEGKIPPVRKAFDLLGKETEEKNMLSEDEVKKLRAKYANIS